MLRSSKYYILAIAFWTILQPFSSVQTAGAVSPSDWRAGRIIDDTVFMNKNDMSVAQIQQFLESKMPACDTYGNVGGGWRKTYDPNNPPPFTCLRDYKEVPKTTPGNWIPESNYGRTDGWAPAGSKSAAEIIWDAAQAYNINPKVLLVTLQKESGLITDDWPLKRQLTYAMGAYCPDSGPGGSANCDVNYSGFSMQIRESADLFRYYLDNMDQPWWTNKRPFQHNTIQYDVDPGCGSSSVYMESRATTALYVYTPYQPNEAALAAGYGEAPCGAYGNRNFWLYYNDWFGSTLDKSFLLAKTSSGTAQYVIYNGLKQLIPSPEVKLAWGLETTPLETVDQAYLDSLTNGPNLDTVFRVNSGMQLYVADSGKRYAIPTVDAWKSWKLDSKAISNVPTGLGITPADGGVLSFTVREAGQPAVYMVDGLNDSNQTILRRYANPDILFGIEGSGLSITTVSSGLFSTIDNDIQSDLISTKIAYGGQEYIASSGQKLPLSYPVATLYPGTASTVSQITNNRFTTGAWMTPFITAYGANEVYLVQNGQRQHIASPEVLNAWMGQRSYISIVNQSLLNTLTNPYIPVTSTIATNATGVYLLNDGGKTLISAGLQEAYRTTQSFNSSTQLMTAIPDGDKVATRFVRNSSNGQISLLDNSSRLNIVSSILLAELWGVNATNTTDLPVTTIDDFSTNSQLLTAHVSDGADTFVPLNGVLKKTSNTNTIWKLPGAQVFSDGTLSSFARDGDLPIVARSGNQFYRIIDGRAYMTTDSRIASIWAIDGSSQDTSRVIRIFMPNLYMLTPVVNDGSSKYLVDRDVLYRINDALLQNTAIGAPPVTADPISIGLPVVDWSTPLFRNSNGGVYVMDAGQLRTFNHLVILNHWTGNGTVSVPAMSYDFIALFRSGTPIERAVKTVNSPNIYSAESATKRWITNPYDYRDLYAPYTYVSDQLINALNSGPNL